MPNLESCVTAYKQLISDNITYKFVLYNGESFKNVELTFTNGEFKHLAGLHKLKDVFPDNISGQYILDNTPAIYSSSLLLKSSHLLDDTGKNSDEKEKMQQDFKKNSSNTPCIFKSELRHRMKTLEEIDSLFLSLCRDNEPFKVYQWVRDDDKTGLKNNNLRPNGSTISADLLLELKNESNNETTCFFIKSSRNDATYTGVSLFQSPETYSKDNSNNRTNKPTRIMKEYKVLSLVREDKNQNKISIISTSDEQLKEIQKTIDNKEEVKLQKTERKNLVSNRISYLKAEQNNDLYKLKKANHSYTTRFISYATNHKKYSETFLKNLITMLDSQKNDSLLSNEHHCIMFERDMACLALLSRELYTTREIELENKKGAYIENLFDFADKSKGNYEDYAIAILQKQKESYDTKEKKSVFSKEEINELKRMIDEEIAMIDSSRGKGDIDKPHDNNNKKITPLVEKPSKTQSLKQIIQTKISQFKNTVSNIKERISNYISSILNSSSSSGGSGTPYAYAGSGESNGGCAVYTIGEVKESSVLQDLYLCMSIVQPTYIATQIDAIRECNHLISLVENMAVMMKEDIQQKKQETLEPAPKEIKQDEKINKPQKAKKQTKYDYDSR